MGIFGFLSRFSNFSPTHFSVLRNSSVLEDIGITWDRPHPGPFIWGLIEKEQGTYDWSRTDDYVQKIQTFGVNILATIWPFAVWDQKVKSGSEERVFEKDFNGLPLLGYGRQKPSDMTAYTSFVRALVERYNGDGVDDMPGLKYPIKHWEVGNEPCFQRSGLVFFKGTPSDYFQILKETYESIKSADADSRVLNGGVAHMRSQPATSHGNPVTFWTEVMRLGGGNYFDIANIHSIGISNEFFVPEFAHFLSKYGIIKPIWVTEAYIRTEGTNLFDKTSLEDHAAAVLKGCIKAFANGATKIFYTHLAVGKQTRDEFRRCALIYDNEKRPAYYAMKTMIKTIDEFNKIEKLADGVYKVKIKSKSVFVFWGKEASLKDFFKGNVLVTDIYGNQQKLKAEEFVASNIPYFIESTQNN